MADLSDDELIALANKKGIQIPPAKDLSDDELISLARSKGIKIPETVALSEKKPQPASPGGELGAGLIRGLNIATFGAAPYVYGGLEAGKALFTEEPVKKAYERGALEYQGALERMGQQHPIGTAVGEGLGLAAFPLATEAKGAQVAGTLGGKIAQAAKGGATQGLLQTPAPKEGDVSFLSPEQRLKQAAMGAAIGGGLQGAVSGAPKALKKIGSTLTGVSEKEIETYAKRANEIDAMAKKSGGDVSLAADEMRQKLKNDIMSAKRGVNDSLDIALNKEPKAQNRVSLNEITDHLQNQASKIDARLYPAEQEAVNDMAMKVMSIADKNNTVTVAELNKIKQFLQDQASSSYMKQGQIFSRAGDVAQSAKGAAALARKTVNKELPNVAALNNRLALLHDIEGKINKNLLEPGKSTAGLMGVGTGSNEVQRKQLERLGQAIGRPGLVSEAENLAAMRTFANPQLLPVDTTGKAFLRSAAGAGVGSAAGGPVGAALGAAASSPAVMKQAIRALRKLPAEPISPAAAAAAARGLIPRD